MSVRRIAWQRAVAAGPTAQTCLPAQGGGAAAAVSAVASTSSSALSAMTNGRKRLKVNCAMVQLLLHSLRTVRLIETKPPVLEQRGKNQTGSRHKNMFRYPQEENAPLMKFASSMMSYLIIEEISHYC